MTERAHILVLTAWLGAIADRLRAQRPSLPVEWEDIDQDLRSFGTSTATPSQLSPYSHMPCPEELAFLLRDIHRRLKGHEDEADIWKAVLERALFCPPDDVVADLLAREVDTVYFGHLPLPDRLLWRFAEHVDEALLTLAKRRFVESSYTVEQFEEVVHSFPTHEWMLESLADMADRPTAKAKVLARYLARHPRCTELIRSASDELRREVSAHRA